jgi:hypothetical protein
VRKLRTKKFYNIGPGPVLKVNRSSIFSGNAACSTALATNRMQQPPPNVGPNGSMNSANNVAAAGLNVTKAQVRNEMIGKVREYEREMVVSVRV